MKREDTETGAWNIETLEGPHVPWITIDPLNPDLETWPSYRHENLHQKHFSKMVKAGMRPN